VKGFNDMDRFGKIALAGLLGVGLMATTACSRGATRGGLIGGAGGAVVGSATGLGTTEGAIIGGTAGAIIGDNDKCSRKERRRGRC
jgi:osmotically inducible lipoprotein OsmB